jgi:hypothetical protein
MLPSLNHKMFPRLIYPAAAELSSLICNRKQRATAPKLLNIDIASKTLPGYRIGHWLHRVRFTSGFGPDWSEDATFVFAHPDGSPWTSEYFCFHYLSLPWKLNARPTLSFAPSMALPEIIFARNSGLHCYRRGTRSHVSRASKKLACYRRATEAQVYEHGRWRRQRSGEKVDVMYCKWLIRDRIKTTLYSML